MTQFKKISQKEYELYQVSDERFPEHTYIIRSEPSQMILYNPHLAGKRLQDLTEKTAKIMIDAMGKTALRDVKLDNICELIFLAGGLYYNLNSGFKQITNEALPQCFIGIKRQRVEGQEGSFTAAATYENFESLPDNATVIIGDTIATGATLQKGINILIDAVEERKYKIKNLIVCTLAGSVVGGEKLKEVETKLKKEFPDSNIYFYACEELFHLMPDGTDLRFLVNGAVMPEETRTKTIEVYGEALGNEMKCAVFDWGTRCKNPKKHYREFLEFTDEILASNKLDEKGTNVIKKMKQETETNLNEFQKPIFNKLNTK
ncbi:MAG: hypothetical protein V1722_01800 [Candidatus Micrarchaeota archaeon]